MSILDKVQFIPRRAIRDERGWFLKLIDGHEEGLPDFTGEFYTTYSEPGAVRGNHYHPLANEWFTVILGVAEVILSDPTTGETRFFMASAQYPLSVYLPAGVGHAFRNPPDATQPMMFAMYADRLYDPADNILLDLF